MTRTCSECHAVMTEGYCIGHGTYYYCGDTCLFRNMTKEEYAQSYHNDDGYWTIFPKKEDE
jgi:hypothetical protein